MLPHPAEDVAMQAARNAYTAVLEKQGANLPSRDICLDQALSYDVQRTWAGMSH